MLIDWVTVRIPYAAMAPETARQLLELGDRIRRFDPRTGEVVYETMAWDSIRSDSHQISVRAGSDAFWIQGSPARIMGDGCAVFGSGASAALNLPGCVDAMRLYVQQMQGLPLPPDLSQWIVSRVDVTGNLLLGSLEEVRAALKILRDCEGGRYRVSAQAGDTVYWSQTSKLRSGKAYAKGPHLEYMNKKNARTALAEPGYRYMEYTQSDIEKANRLLRLELKLAREFWARNEWQTFDSEDLKLQWTDYFSRMIGSAEMTDDKDLKGRIMSAATTEGQGRAAYGCWLLIQSEGWERARESFAKSTWYRNLKILRAAGLGDADISAGTVVPLRRRVFEARLVSSWPDLRAAS